MREHERAIKPYGLEVSKTLRKDRRDSLGLSLNLVSGTENQADLADLEPGRAMVAGHHRSRHRLALLSLLLLLLLEPPCVAYLVPSNIANECSIRCPSFGDAFDRFAARQNAVVDSIASSATTHCRQGRSYELWVISTNRERGFG